MSVDLVVRGKLVSHIGIWREAAIAVKDGKVVAITHSSQAPKAREVVDYGELLILPGVVDNHTHSLGVKEEGHWNSTSSAAAGGVTTINDHPLDLGGAPSSRRELQQKAEKTSKESVIDFALLAGGLPEKLENMLEVGDFGVTGYKILMHSTAGSSDYKMRAVNDGELYALFEAAAQVNLPAMVHAENDWIINLLVERYLEADKVYPAAHCETRPDVTETVAVATAIELAKALGCRLHILHASVPRTFELISQAREKGIDVTGETCPHYLVCNENRWKEVGANFKINPPLRSEEFRVSLWKLLKAGMIHLVASDHAPHVPNIDLNIFNNFSGSPGVETMLPLIFDEGVNKGRIGLTDLVRVLAYNPARLTGIYPQKGVIAVGSDADIVVFDPDHEWVIEGSKLRSQSGWSLYEGMKIKGKVRTTFVRGKRVFADGEVIGEKGYGVWVKRQGFYNL